MNSLSKVPALMRAGKEMMAGEELLGLTGVGKKKTKKEEAGEPQGRGWRAV